MRNAVIITGTDTGIGKTVFAAGLAGALGATYWKPVQAGLAGETDSETAARLGAHPVLPERYRLRLPLAPHLAAQAEGIEIDPAALALPNLKGPLVVEGAGGLMVPLNSETLYLDVIARWGAPVILCARTTLGTINHSLLSLRALREAGCAVLGVAFIGTANAQAEATIAAFGDAAHLGTLPLLPHVSRESLAAAFTKHVDLAGICAGLDRAGMTP